MIVKQESRDERREHIRERIQNSHLKDRQLIEIPADEVKSINDDSVEKRVCAYCRVSTDDPAQTTSYELQKQHYEEQISSHPGWVFAGIYADEGISATSMKKRDDFNRMLADCYEGKIDLIVTKSVSRFARNVVDCLSVIRKLAQLTPPVYVIFETEGFNSLESTSEMILTVMAAAAQEESKTKSNSMNWSLDKRFKNGNFLTPVLLGYDHDEDGNLVVNHEEAVTVKLIFYLYLSGYPLSEIAKLLTEMERPTKKGNTVWNTTSIRQILENERHCGNVLSWKTYTYDFWEHKKRKNRKNRRQVLEVDHHEAIVSHEVFDAVQAKLQEDKFARHHSPLPTLDVVEKGALKGFVSVNRKWRGFTDKDYRKASESVYEYEEPVKVTQENPLENEFWLDGFEVVRAQFFSGRDKPMLTISAGRIHMNTVCLRKFSDVEYVEVLLNTVEGCIAIRPCSRENPNAIRWGRKKDGRWIGTYNSITGFAGALFSIADWDMNCRYQLCGQFLSEGDEKLLLFDLSEPEIIRLVQTGEEQETLEESDAQYRSEANAKEEERQTDADDADQKPIPVMTLQRTYPPEWENEFGDDFRKRASSYFERIRYIGDWQILRPAKTFAIAAGVSPEVLREVNEESRKMIEELGCAV